MVEPLQPEKHVDTVSAAPASRDAVVDTKTAEVTSAVETLLADGTITDPVDRDLLNRAVIFLRHPSTDLAVLREHQENIGAVIGGYEQMGADVPEQISTVFGHLMTLSFTASVPEATETPLTSAALLDQLKGLPRLLGGEYQGPTSTPRAQHIAITEQLCRAQCRDVESALAADTPDIAECKRLMQIAFGTAKQLLDGYAQKSDMMAELVVWQSAMGKTYEHAVGELVAIYEDQIDIESKKPRPDVIESRRAMLLSSGFVPERGAEIRAKYQEVLGIYCGGHLTILETELQRETGQRDAAKIAESVSRLGVQRPFIDPDNPILLRLEDVLARIDQAKRQQ